MKRLLILVLLFSTLQISIAAANGLQSFDKNYYLSAKLASLALTHRSWADKTNDDLEQFLLQCGFTPESHYTLYGYTEGFPPNRYFNHAQYILAKATAMHEAGGYDSVEQARAAFLAAWSGDAYLHYILYGAAEGLNPSDNFDESAYLAAKLEKIQASAPEWKDKSISDLRKVLASMGITAIDHYLLYGAAEGLSPTAVPEGEKAAGTAASSTPEWQNTDKFQANLLSTMAGTYAGTYTGDRTGIWVLAITDDGAITGGGYDNRTGDFVASGSVNSNGEMLLVEGGAGYTARFTGTITLQGIMCGSWAEGSVNAGTYTGLKEEIETTMGAQIAGIIGSTWTYKGYRGSTPGQTWEESIKLLGASKAYGFLFQTTDHQKNGKTRVVCGELPYNLDETIIESSATYEVDRDGDLVKRSYELETVTVPAGTFDTVKITSHTTTYIPGLAYESHSFPAGQVCIDYFAMGPTPLLVKEIDFWVDDPSSYIMELTAY